MILSILICSLTERMGKLGALLRTLDDQIDNINGRPKKVEVLIEVDDGEKKGGLPTGSKRNKLVRKARGKYIVFIDDDDEIPGYYVSEILKAAKSNPDCIGINGVITTDGVNEKKWYISKEYGRWYEKDNVYFRTPNHISPVKREIALKVPFPPVSSGEDSDYSTRILPLLKSETIIQKPMYNYIFKTKR